MYYIIYFTSAQQIAITLRILLIPVTCTYRFLWNN